MQIEIPKSKLNWEMGLLNTLQDAVFAGSLMEERERVTRRTESVGSTASGVAAMTMGSKKALAYGGQQGMVNGGEKEAAKACQTRGKVEKHVRSNFDILSIDRAPTAQSTRPSG